MEKEDPTVVPHPCVDDRHPHVDDQAAVGVAVLDETAEYFPRVFDRVHLEKMVLASVAWNF